MRREEALAARGQRVRARAGAPQSKPLPMRAARPPPRRRRPRGRRPRGRRRRRRRGPRHVRVRAPRARAAAVRATPRIAARSLGSAPTRAARYGQQQHVELLGRARQRARRPRRASARARASAAAGARRGVRESRARARSGRRPGRLSTTRACAPSRARARARATYEIESVRGGGGGGGGRPRPSGGWRRRGAGWEEKPERPTAVSPRNIATARAPGARRAARHGRAARTEARRVGLAADERDGGAQPRPSAASACSVPSRPCAHTTTRRPASSTASTAPPVAGRRRARRRTRPRRGAARRAACLQLRPSRAPPERGRGG